MKTLFLILGAVLLAGGPVCNARELVAAWDFDEPGAQLKDGTGKVHGEAIDLAVEPNDAGDSPGQAAVAAGNLCGVFNGSTSQVILRPGADAPWAAFERADFTLTGWFQLHRNERGVDVPLITALGNLNQPGWSLQIGRADRTRKGQLFFTVGGRADGKAVTILSPRRVDDGKWHWFAIVVRSEAVHLYLDGVYHGSVPYNAASNATIVEPEVRIGARGKVHFNGRLDRLRIYDYALTELLDGQKKLMDSELYHDWQRSEGF